MNIIDICERLKNVKSVFNDKVYTINEERLIIEETTLLGFAKIDDGNSRNREYGYYAFIEGDYNPAKYLKIEIEKLYSNKESAQTALNEIIQQKVDALLAKKA